MNIEIKIPEENSTYDSDFQITSLLVQNNYLIKKGQPIAVIENSMFFLILRSTVDGVVLLNVNLGDYITPNDVVCVVKTDINKDQAKLYFKSNINLQNEDEIQIIDFQKTENQPTNDLNGLTELLLKKTLSDEKYNLLKNNKKKILLQKIESLEDGLEKKINSLNNNTIDNFDFYTNYLDNRTEKNKPIDFLKIGSLFSSTYKFPALFPFYKMKGIAFEINENNKHDLNLIIEDIVFQIASNIDLTYCKFTIIDPKNLGASFPNLRRLNSNIIDKIVIDENDIKKHIKANYEESIKITTECLSQYSSIEDYNKETGNKQPFRIMIISNFPYGFRDNLEKLYTTIHNGIQLGFFILMTYDNEINDNSKQDKIIEILNLLTKFKQRNNLDKEYEIENLISQNIYNNFSLIIDTSIINSNTLNSYVKKLNKANKNDILWNRNDGLKIPIGKTSGETHYLTIGHETDNYHGIIGGQSQKGKTVLLNNIVTRGIENYSESELSFILIDCAGVGFQEYQNSRHTHTLIASSNIEECVEGIKILENELKKRENLFREKKVQKITDFNKVSENKLPRIMCLIDEFHILYTGNSRTSSYIDTILVDKVIRIGAKFGIHLIVSTQSLGGGVRRSILDNIPLRIALGMTTDQSMSFLGYKNDSATNLERGVAIYNTQNGSIEANKIVKINYISTEEINLIVN